MFGDKKLIRLNDPVIIYNGNNNVDVIYVTENKMYDSKYGHYYHNNFVGVEYGSKVYDLTGKGGYVYVLKPTPELWTLALPHRTEILYSWDISLITYHLELKPGSIVIESGTGSGSLSTAIARSIAPTGHLYTYEFHKGRAEAAANDFKKNKIENLITVHCSDVCVDGFADVEDGCADAVFFGFAIPVGCRRTRPQKIKIQLQNLFVFAVYRASPKNVFSFIRKRIYRGKDFGVPFETVRCIKFGG